MAILFVADIHLGEEHPAIGHRFRAFLESELARRAEALYILGDLFELWIGDDAPTPHQRPLLDALAELSGRGVPLFVMRGNRDFLLGKGFEAATGARLIDDPATIDLHGTPALLMHGDTLCTDDEAYQAFRRQVRDPRWQANFLAQSPEQRLEFARKARRASRAESRGKPEAIMDVNQEAVAEAMRTHGVGLLIHGHTHRPAIHEFELDGRPARRIVLGDWYRAASVLKVEGDAAEAALIDPSRTRPN